MSSPGRPLAPSSGTAGAVMVPVKAFGDAKERLSKTLGQATRAQLAREMATHLVQAQQDAVVAICCDDEEVAEWATSVGADPSGAPALT